MLDEDSQEPEGVRDRLVGRCTSGVAHELNNFLGAILNYSELIEVEEDLSEDGREKLHAIKSAAEQSASLLEALLISARPSKGAVSVVSLDDVLQQVLLISAFSLRRARVEVQCQVQTTDPPNASTDRSKLILIILSLLETVAGEEPGRASRIVVHIREVGDSLHLELKPFLNRWPDCISGEEERAMLSDFTAGLGIQIQRPTPDALVLQLPKNAE